MDLEDLFEKDPRVEKAYRYSKPKYQKANLCQHNWNHIVGNLYRALKIANTEKNVNYSVLIVSVLFHDIGITEGDYSRHEERGIEIAERELPKFGFTDEEVGQVKHAVKTTGEDAESQTIEAKINSDADKLVKCGKASIFNYFRVQRELGKPLEDMLEDLSKYEKLKEQGFYTEKAREIGGNGFEERIKFLKEYREELKKREDFTATEEDLFSI